MSRRSSNAPGGKQPNAATLARIEAFAAKMQPVTALTVHFARPPTYCSFVALVAHAAGH
jgi:hypothetical protein